MENQRCHFAISRYEDIVESKQLNKSVPITTGTLLRIVTNVPNSSVVPIQLFNNQNGEFDDNNFDCKLSVLAVVRETLWNFLVACREPADRILILQNQRTLLELAKGQSLSVTLIIKQINEKVRGKVFQIGPVAELGFGHYIGITLQDYDLPYNQQSKIVDALGLSWKHCVFLSAEYINKPLHIIEYSNYNTVEKSVGKPTSEFLAELHSQRLRNSSINMEDTPRGFHTMSASLQNKIYNQHMPISNSPAQDLIDLAHESHKIAKTSDVESSLNRNSFVPVQRPSLYATKEQMDAPFNPYMFPTNTNNIEPSTKVFSAQQPVYDLPQINSSSGFPGSNNNTQSGIRDFQMPVQFVSTQTNTDSINKFNTLQINKRPNNQPRHNYDWENTDDSVINASNLQAKKNNNGGDNVLLAFDDNSGISNDIEKIDRMQKELNIIRKRITEEQSPKSNVEMSMENILQHINELEEVESNTALLKAILKAANNKLQLIARRATQSHSNKSVINLCPSNERRYNNNNTKALGKPQTQGTGTVPKQTPKSVPKQIFTQQPEPMPKALHNANYTTSRHECGSCKQVVEPNNALNLKTCKHIICFVCLRKEIKKDEKPIICPFKLNYMSCRAPILDEEVEAVLTTATQPPSKEDKFIYCKTKSCQGAWFTDGASNLYVCPICEQYNCIDCDAIHAGMTCKEYNAKLDPRNAAETVNENQELWDCVKCTYQNDMSAKKCQMCSTFRQQLPRAFGENAAKPKQQHRGGNSKSIWSCLHCSFENNSDNHICEMCGKSDPNYILTKESYNKSQEYYRLLCLEKKDLIQNNEPFECIICTDEFEEGQGAILRGCHHIFCKNCITKLVDSNAEAIVKCPLPECSNTIQDREIMAIVSQEIYDKHINRSLVQGKASFVDGFQCQTVDCIGFWVYEKDIYNYNCPKCNAENCTQCRALHGGMNCREYQEKIFYTTSPEAIKTKEKLEAMIKNNEAMQCPNCKIVISKNGGCNDMYCVMCRKAFRWAPGQKEPTYIANWRCHNCFTINSIDEPSCKKCNKNKLKHNANTSKTGNRVCLFCRKSGRGGRVLENCYHFFCFFCLDATLRFADHKYVCPFQRDDYKCSIIMSDNDVKALVKPQNKNVIEEELMRREVKKIKNAFLCKRKNCTGWWILEEGDNLVLIQCPVCNAYNCVKCDAVHEGMSCLDYNEVKSGRKVIVNAKDAGAQYLELINMDDDNIVANKEQFECQICYADCEPGEGIMLRDCLHEFCRNCITGQVKAAEEAEVRCPFRDDKCQCNSIIQEREIKAAVDDQTYEQYLDKSLRIGQGTIKNGYYCKTVDCRGYWINDENINENICPICGVLNCMQCQAIHVNMNCKEFQDKTFNDTDPTALATKTFLQQMVKDGTGMHCPQCNIIIARVVGCDWLQCAMCRCEICWVTKGPRRGPNGCRCREVNGRLCHPNCGNCH